jgi:hypothetical protein
MARTRGAFGSIARGRVARKRERALVLFALLVAGCAAPSQPAPPAPPPATQIAHRVPGASLGMDRYQGLLGAELIQLLGKPDFRRRDLDAEIWQYRAGGCILDLFLYQEEGVFRVLHAESRSRTTGRACPETPVEERAAEARF